MNGNRSSFADSILEGYAETLVSVGKRAAKRKNATLSPSAVDGIRNVLSKEMENRRQEIDRIRLTISAIDLDQFIKESNLSPPRPRVLRTKSSKRAIKSVASYNVRVLVEYSASVHQEFVQTGFVKSGESIEDSFLLSILDYLCPGFWPFC